MVNRAFKFCTVNNKNTKMKFVILDVDDSNHEPTEKQKEICQKLKEFLLNTNVRVRLSKLKAIPKKDIKEQIRIRIVEAAEWWSR